MERSYVDELRSTWEALGETDPLWGVLSDPSKTGGRWDPIEFFESGRAHIDALIDELRRLRVPLKRADALDFGCGVGRLTQALAEHFTHVVGVDISSAMIRAAEQFNQHGQRCQFVHNAADNLSVLDSHSVDFVLSFIVLQHMRPSLAEGYIAEFARVLRPAGVLVVQVPGYLMTNAHPIGTHRAAIELTSAPDVFAAGQPALIEVRITNASDIVWTHSPAHPINLGTHWRSIGGALLVKDAERVAIPLPLDPGDSTVVTLPVLAPSAETCILEVDLVEEGITWFADAGSEVASTLVHVKGGTQISHRDESPTAVVAPPTPSFEMNSISPSRLISCFESSGVRVVQVEQDRSAGDAWHSYRYVAIKDLPTN